MCRTILIFTFLFFFWHVQLLNNKLGSEPQLPHADDFNSRALFLVCNVLPDQTPTEVTRFEPKGCCPELSEGYIAASVAKDEGGFPVFSGISVKCDECNRWTPDLPSSFIQEGIHRREKVSCDDLQGLCSKTSKHSIELKIAASFGTFFKNKCCLCADMGIHSWLMHLVYAGTLLEYPEETVKCMRPAAGVGKAKVGGGL